MSPRSHIRDAALLVEKSYLDGQLVEAADGNSLPVINPATGEWVASVPALGAAETRAAIAAADQAWEGWRGRPAADRANLLMRWHDLILQNEDDLATIMTLEQGKPLVEARGEVRYGASFVKWFAEEAVRAYGDVIPAPESDRRILVLKQSVGVSAAITPWNFPVAMITRKLAPALAAGCPTVVKPSELTPLSALALAVLAERAGVPKGVINVVTGLPSGIGGELTGNETVRKLSFTGSTEVGKILMAQCAGSVKRVSFELGGNAPFIVFDDADLDLAISGVLASKFRNGGQTCVCANRILVQSGIYERFAERLAAEAAKIVVGNGLDKGITMGPMISETAVGKIVRIVDDALAHGARMLTGSTTHNRLFVLPTVLTDATPEMSLAQEEIFGPVAPLFRFGSEEEAIAIANATPFGLAAYFYTNDLRRSWRVAEQLEFGMVGLNTGSVSVEAAPFGGIKQSGLGREGSMYGIDEYLEIKAFHVGGLSRRAIGGL
ncbi:NAD-dependent succinate-semialdehyde dehydrogenase [Bradyrhizobium manausense]|uniref:NAD-dependent succinate-semialdehyde dehydrogenase n=1 Tax=Bradyrhizobium manausense TaxID=989370 RepID=UPI001BA79F83|nr:NAD-dependent succinate-semialdehyde dehydrogenase [Bradyrhizobium manausense]MBR0724204.1 NAD-dependent succinate-semialdehyde dehydrogenase [Bradyrhizobium manausense]